MTIYANARLDQLAYPAGPAATGIRYSRGTLTLVAGTASEAIAGYVNPTVMITRRVAAGVIGDLTGQYGGGNVVIQSGNAGDTSAVDYFIFE